MASAKEVNLSTQYAELNRFAQNGEYERALKSANKILQHAPGEEKAFHCKVVCFIKLDKFQEGLKAITNQSNLSSNLIFEKAYCQYRLNQTHEALKTVNSCSNLSLKLKELKAQILYRLEKYEECFDVYRDIIKNSNDDYEDEREANLSAVISNLCVEDPKRDVPQLREHTYELSYNAACQLISRGQYQEAEKKLKIAEKLCRESLEDDGASEEDIEDELGIIKVQLAYCLHVQGREKEAQAIYAAVLKQKPADIGLVAIISNNLITLNKDQNVFDSKKKIKSATLDGLEHKLTSRQRKKIALNHCLLALYTNQGEQCQQLCERLQQNYPDMGVEAALIRAVQLAKDGKTKEAATVLDKCSVKHKDRKLALKLAAVQLLLTDGDRKEACKILQTLGDATFKPGIVSALVTLYLADNNREGASVVLKDAVDWYRKNKVSTGDLSTLWRQAAEFHLRGGEPNVAAKSLEELLRLNPGDKKTLAQLVVAYAQFDPAKAQALSKELPPLDFTNRADVDALETSNWMMGSKVIKKAAAKVEPSPKPDTPRDELLQKKKSKRKRKPKLPKNYNPDVPPDPERWLPRHERTGYRKKKDRRNKDIGKGTQGAATGASDMYDITKMPSQQVKASPNPHGSPAPESAGPRQQQRKVQQKKKKKGGKW
ncbi:signal recognition particle subunit SRP72 [Schistocerca piceifrons]|uniref:signal recognition particle subunit SRP72 n=1 Tax=Schistocerca piceifrons TaxID=274613 RepID=UPI001F5EC7EB|nr:signal recognition particle subunit SRP72 [Schistocerca piceifrons]XP_049785159.1 signal recognition particle subunit SRP72 [Schistocerca cancellata]XP_049960789.1 signal recognition particle subunit SRP72 [Schistocerca serialis cubense]